MAKVATDKADILLPADGGGEHAFYRRKIFLTGFSGSGKTSIGPLLARHLEYDFRDTDSEIEKRCRTTCTEIIEQRGLPCFRSLEKDLLLELLADRSLSCVVALGGGAVTIPGLIPLLRENGWVVWLRLGLSEILTRLAAYQDRPLLRKKTEAEIARFLAEREVFYRRAAHLTVEVGGLDVETARQKVMESLAGYGWKQEPAIVIK